MTLSRLSVVVVVAALVVVGLWLGLVISRLLRSASSKRRNSVALDAEHEAEALLEAHGYRVLERQARASFTMQVDGEPVTVLVRADLLVRRKGRTFVAEVKSGQLAPSLAHAPTRRQLLEYALVFDAHEVLLVDVPSRKIQSVCFVVEPREDGLFLWGATRLR